MAKYLSDSEMQNVSDKYRTETHIGDDGVEVTTTYRNGDVETVETYRTEVLVLENGDRVSAEITERYSQFVDGEPTVAQEVVSMYGGTHVEIVDSVMRDGEAVIVKEEVVDRSELGVDREVVQYREDGSSERISSQATFSPDGGTIVGRTEQTEVFDADGNKVMESNLHIDAGGNDIRDTVVINPNSGEVESRVEYERQGFFDAERTITIAEKTSDGRDVVMTHVQSEERGDSVVRSFDIQDAHYDITVTEEKTTIVETTEYDSGRAVVVFENAQGEGLDSNMARIVSADFYDENGNKIESSDAQNGDVVTLPADVCEQIDVAQDMFEQDVSPEEYNDAVDSVTPDAISENPDTDILEQPEDDDDGYGDGGDSIG